MATPRPAWSVTTNDDPDSRIVHTSRYAAFQAVKRDATPPTTVTVTTVWVDERDGNGWQLYERVEHKREAQEKPPAAVDLMAALKASLLQAKVDRHTRAKDALHKREVN